MSLQEIYARIPDVHCKGKCQEACGPIGMSLAEYGVLRGRVGDRMPPPTGTGQQFIVSRSLACPLLSADGKCSIYTDRPAICRLWGAVKAMRCQFGCRPKRWLKEGESRAILAEINSLPTPQNPPMISAP